VIDQLLQAFASGLEQHAIVSATGSYLASNDKYACRWSIEGNALGLVGGWNTLRWLVWGRSKVFS
jgi:hypothetical protein